MPIGLLNQDTSINTKVKRAHVPYNRVSGPHVPTRTGQRLIICNSEIKLFVHLIDSRALSNLLLATFYLLDIGIIFARVGLQGLFPPPLVIRGCCGRCKGVQQCIPLLGGAGDFSLAEVQEYL